MKSLNRISLSTAFAIGHAWHCTDARPFQQDSAITCFMQNYRLSQRRSKTVYQSVCQQHVMQSNLRYKRSKSILHTSSLPSESHDTESISPWSPGKWRITLQFKREENQSETSLFGNEASNSENNALITKLLGDEWGCNSAQLVLPFDILVTADVSSDDHATDSTKSIESAWLGGKPTGAIKCIPLTEKESHHAIYINNKGQQHVQISPGNWRIESPTPQASSATGKPLPGQAFTLRFSLTIKTPIERNSIYFPENQILLLQCNTFREEQYEDGLKTIRPYQRAKDEAQEMLNKQLDHESGDRRLDGKDLLPLLKGYKDVAGLVWERDERYNRWKKVESVLPLVGNVLNEDDDRWGIWPGDTDLMVIERGVVLAVVEKKEEKRLFPWVGNGEGSFDTVVVGRWTAVPVWDVDDKEDDPDYTNDDELRQMRI